MIAPDVAAVLNKDFWQWPAEDSVFVDINPVATDQVHKAWPEAVVCNTPLVKMAQNSKKPVAILNLDQS